MVDATGSRNFIDIGDLDRDELERIIDAAIAMKAARIGAPKGRRDKGRPLADRILALIFEKPSTRTRVSFDVAMRQLGGETLVLSSADLQLGRGETISDTAKVLSRLVDAIMIRSGSHDNVVELGRVAGLPVINGLTPRSHPCQIVADLVTLREHAGPLSDRVVVWCGDANNVQRSLMQAAALLGFEYRIACPRELAPAAEELKAAQAENPRITVHHDPAEAVDGAECVVTDAWVSMGDTDEDRRCRLLEPFRVDGDLMDKAAGDAIFMHCLPAYRGREVTAEVIDGPRSVVFDEAENRLHAQKAILSWCFGRLG